MYNKAFHNIAILPLAFLTKSQ